MKAIILASGIGKRLRPLTDKKPKSLIKINNKTILEYQLDILKKCNITNVIITTGPFADEIQRFVKEKYKDFTFLFVPNPQYDTTNYIYSLWLTKDYIDDDILLLHGDLIFTEKLLKKMIKTNGNVVPVNNKIEVPEKDFKAVIDNNKVKKIGVNFFGKNTFFSLPLYKFTKRDFLAWMNEMEKEIKDKKLNIYAENAFNNISDEIELKPLYFNDKLCMEIDTKEDLKIIKEMTK